MRKLHAEDVLGTTLETLDAIKPRVVGTKHGTGTYLRPISAATAPVVSIEMKCEAIETDAAEGPQTPAGTSKKSTNGAMAEAASR